MSGSIIKTIRIRAVDLPKVECVMRDKGLTWSGAIHDLLSEKGARIVVKEKEVPAKTGCGSLPKGLYKDIDSMLSVNGLSYERFMEIIDKLMNDGSIIVSPDSVVTTDSRVNVSALIDRCDEAGIKNYQAVFDKLIKSLRFT